MISIRRVFATACSAFGGAGLLFMTTAPTADAATATRIGAPYEAGGVWYVPAADMTYDQEGLAAEYDGYAAGGVTFGGDRFDPLLMAAGSPTLPTNTVVEVTNLDTGKMLQLRINDRGPSAPERVLNLTPAAARALGIQHGQSAHVRVRYPQTTPNRAGAKATIAAEPTSKQAYSIQIGAFSQRERAQQAVDQVASVARAQITPLKREGATLYRVTLPARDAEDASALQAQLGGLGFPGAHITTGM